MKCLKTSKHTVSDWLKVSDKPWLDLEVLKEIFVIESYYKILQKKDTEVKESSESER